jgi:pimeloyl-ACP methyl ester carboxylesterase
VQEGMAEREADVSDERRIQFRIGVNLGDIVIDGEDILGDGVNIASRLEGLAEPGGICISAKVFDEVGNKLDVRFEDLGKFEVKNIADPLKVYRVVSANRTIDASTSPSVTDQTVRFCTASDGVRIAYSTIGHGPPIVRAGSWVTHLELDWGIPTRRELVEMLARNRTVVRYDQRGNGLSDWDVEDISFDAFIDDLEAVIDDLGLDRFALFGQSQGAAVAAVYAARYPKKVSHLVMLGGFARGRRKRGLAGQTAESDALITLIREGWGKDNPAYVQMFGSFFMPDANSDQLAAFTALQKATTTPENAARIRFAIDDIDVSDEMEKVKAPTLVVHAREDVMAPLEEGRRIAAAISGAVFVQLESRNHTLLPNEPAWKRFLEEVQSFLAS